MGYRTITVKLDSQALNTLEEVVGVSEFNYKDDDEIAEALELLLTSILPSML